MQPHVSDFIERIRKERADFKRTERAAIDSAQSSCAHVRIAHWSGHDGFSTPQYPLRICLECGYEEHGGWWTYGLPAMAGFADGIQRMHDGWHDKDNYQKHVLAYAVGRDFFPVSFDEIMKCRP